VQFFVSSVTKDCSPLRWYTDAEVPTNGTKDATRKQHTQSNIQDNVTQLLLASQYLSCSRNLHSAGLLLKNYSSFRRNHQGQFK